MSGIAREVMNPLDEVLTRSDLTEPLPSDADPDVTDVHQFMLADVDGRDGPAPEERPGLTDDEIAAYTQREIDQAIGHDRDELSENRILAYRYYRGELAKAPAGRSSAVDLSVADVLEWTKPQVVAALLDADDVVSFEATSEDDVEQAQLETDACRRTMMQENPGFITLQSAIHDALLLRNGVVRVEWVDTPKVSYHQHSGLTLQEVQAVLQPQDNSQVEVLGQEQRQVMLDDPQTGQPVEVTVYDIDTRRTQLNGRVYITPVPMEEFLRNKDHDSVDLSTARFAAQRSRVTRSDLVAEGYDPEQVANLPTWTDDYSGEREERRREEGALTWQDGSLDPALQLVWKVDCIVMIDQDQDGVAELLHVVMAGDISGLELLSWEHADQSIFVGCAGILAPHQFTGVSLFDRVGDIANQKTKVLRAVQDNLAHQNTVRTLVVAGQVNLEDLMTNRPGGIVRQRQPGMVEPLTAPQIGEWGYAHLDYLDRVRTGRAGVSPDTANVAEAIAGDTAHGLERIMSAKEELTGLIIKTLANTLISPLMNRIRSLLQMHRTTPMQFRRRGEWVEVDPSEWKDRDSACEVQALSQGDRVRRATAYTTVLGYQEKAVAAGGLGTLVTEKNIYNAMAGLVRTTMIGDPSPYFTNPESDEANAYRQQQAQQAQQQAQQAQQAQMAVIQAQQQIEAQKEETKRLTAMMDAKAADADRVAEMERKLLDLEAKYTEMELAHAVDVPGHGMDGLPESSAQPQASPFPQPAPFPQE